MEFTLACQLQSDHSGRDKGCQMVYFQAEIPILEGHAVGIYEMA
jgi:hypothetical protein